MSNIDTIFSDTMGIGSTPSSSTNTSSVSIDYLEPMAVLPIDREAVVQNIVNPVVVPSINPTPPSVTPPIRSTSLTSISGNSVVVPPTIKSDTPKVDVPKADVPKVDVPKKQETQTPKQDLPKTNNLVDSKKKVMNRNITIGLAVVGLGGILYFLARK